MSRATIGSPSKVSSSRHDPQHWFKMSKVINPEPPVFRLASPHPIGCYSYTLQTGADYARGPASSGFAPPDSPAKAKVRGWKAPQWLPAYAGRTLGGGRGYVGDRFG